MNAFLKVLTVLIIAIVLGAGGYFLWKKYSDTPQSSNSSFPTKIEIPKKILDNKFGFLSAGPDSAAEVVKYDASWQRPHPGPFVWDAMQKGNNSEISFESSDKIVKDAQENQVGILATLFPFAEWDQNNRPDAIKCAVSENDEFLSTNDKKGRGDYLPSHRCAPNDWNAYNQWIAKIVERYDGDGQDDMKDLKIPIKYWEVMNEPDLPVMTDGRLVFWLDTPEQYAKLLTETNKIIKQADPDAKVLIAGAAGGSPEFLNFYRQVLKNPEALTSFDIGNVHCISNDENSDFNVSAYKKMLSEFNLTQPIWVTEAENMNGQTLQENAELTKKSTQGALAAGALRIFYTRYNFEDFRKDMSEKNAESEESITKSQELYKSMFSSLN